MITPSPTKPEADLNTVIYFRRTCEQIEQEINSILATMAA